jgi:hypothetical protein
LATGDRHRPVEQDEIPVHASTMLTAEMQAAGQTFAPSEPDPG